MPCSSCGAPLPPKSRSCQYCGTLNDVDLRSVRHEHGGVAQRDCPRCKTRLEVLSIELAGGVEIDRCGSCHGIFFDPGELESILEQAETKTFAVDAKRLEVMAEEEIASGDLAKVEYVPCPGCGQLMHRRNFGTRSGVIVDQCRDHGVWLDGGELRRLVEWARAGGRLHAAKQEAEAKAAEERLGRMPSTVGEPVAPLPTSTSHRGPFSDGGLSGGYFDLMDVVDVVSWVARALKGR